MRSRMVLSALVAGLLAVGAGAAAMRPDGDTMAPAITDAQGRSLVLRGFSTISNAKTTPDGLPRFTEADLDQEYGDMGTNFVRLLISWRAVEPEQGVYDQTYLDKLETIVGWYADRGYHVMLDMHQDTYGGHVVPGKEIGNGAPKWATFTDGLAITEQDMWELYYLEPGIMRAFDNFWGTTGRHLDLVDHYVGAWKAVAERFADNDAVIAYDIMNEPFGGSLQGTEFESGPLTVLHQKATDAIRTVDENTWVCVEPQAVGFNWGTPSAVGRIDDPREGDDRIAFCPHLYPLPMDLGDGFVGTSKTLVEQTVTAWLGTVRRSADALGGVPVILGEFGLDTTLPGAIDYVDLVYRESAARNFGVAYWSRDDGSWGPYADGRPRNLVPALDLAYPRAVAGGIRTLTTTPDRVEVTYTNDPAVTAPTEVYLPARTFGEVTFAGGTLSGATVTGGTVVGWDNDRRILRVTGAAGAEETTLVVAAS